MKTITKRDWTAALNDVTGEEHSPKSFKTVADAQAAFEAAAREAGVIWDVTDEGIAFSDFSDPEQPAEDEQQQPAEDAQQPVQSEEDQSADPAEAPRTPGRAATHLGSATITVVAESNPKREGTKAHAMFALYTTGMTVAEFLRAGGRRVDLRWDEAHGFISVA